jgi:molecular chaperone HtpG
LIGQFGVGFYSSFIVADKVTLITRRAGMGPEHGVRWESDGQGEFTIDTITRQARGTDVILHLREGEGRAAVRAAVGSIIRKYSDHITVPHPDAQGRVGQRQERVSDAVRARADQSGVRALGASEERDHRRAIPGVLQARRARFEPPLTWVHARIEGKQEYTVLLYVPQRAPFDLWDRDHRHGVKLYVQRVFIMDDAEQLMPAYLRFVRGVIDSNDLPLNISREILQQSKVVEAIRGGAVKRVLSQLEELAGNDADKYAKFWKEFGRVLKEGHR